MALKATHSIGTFSFETDFVPQFNPAILPAGEFLNAFFEKSALDTMNINIVRTVDFLKVPLEN